MKVVYLGILYYFMGFSFDILEVVVDVWVGYGVGLGLMSCSCSFY